MNKLTRKLLSVFLAVAMIVTILPPVTAQAATKTEKMTLYKGEILEVSDNYLSTVKSVSTTKKSIVAAKKDPKRDYKAVLTAKKTGKSTVTVKTKRGTFKYAITVKNYNFAVSFKDIGNNKILMTVKNNNKDAFDQVQFTYSLCDASGNVVEKKEKVFSDLLPGKKSYETISVYGLDIDPSQCSAKVKANNRYPDAKYTNLGSKVKVTTTENTTSDYTEITLKMKNNSKSSARGSVFVLIYDAQDNIIEMRDVYVGTLDAGNVKTDSIKIYNYIGEYDHCEVVPAIYSKTF